MVSQPQMNLDAFYKDRPVLFRQDLARAEELRRTNPDLAKLHLIEVLRVMQGSKD